MKMSSDVRKVKSTVTMLIYIPTQGKESQFWGYLKRKEGPPTKAYLAIGRVCKKCTNKGRPDLNCSPGLTFD